MGDRDRSPRRSGMNEGRYDIKIAIYMDLSTLKSRIQTRHTYLPF